MKPEIEKLSCAWYKAEKELFDALEKLPNYGEECNCGWENKEEPEPIQFIWADGKWPEIQQRCLNCGGDVGV